ncbi:MAG: hypothetical protein DLM59_14715 [Pseudonocardiales bacterium]|nr:MAG: hypothetical protein DLM59_14715 [Pseudonocardiales bacterium]
MLARLVEYVCPALTADGDAVFVDAAVDTILGRGTGATAQRQAFDRAGRISDVVEMLAEETAKPGAPAES